LVQPAVYEYSSDNESLSADLSSELEAATRAEEKVTDKQRAYLQAKAIMEFKQVAGRGLTAYNELEVPVKQLKMEHLATALTGQPTLLSKKQIEETNLNYVKEGKLTYKHPTKPNEEVVHRRYIDLLSPKGNPMMRLSQPAWQPRPRVRSTVTGRLELEHIEDMLDTMRVKPDFGYNTQAIVEDEEA
jgi:hypothetical protein